MVEVEERTFSNKLYCEYALPFLIRHSLTPLVTSRSQPKCEHCFHTPFDDVTKGYRPFIACSDCRLAFFCSQACQNAAVEEHRLKQCSILQDLGQCELLQRGHTKLTGDTMMQIPTQQPRRTYIPLSTAKTWKAYFETISDKSESQCITDNFSPVPGNPENERICRILKLSTDASTNALTILAGLEATLPDLITRTCLTMHIVGAELQELLVQRLNEELLHLLPNLQRLVVGYIGPHVPSESHGDELEDVGCCTNCMSANRTRSIFIKRDLYHDFTKSRLFATHPPDLIAAFHPGFSQEEVKSWQPTLERILDLDVPSVFTSYNVDEVIEEEEALQKLVARFLKKPEENQWRARHPYLDYATERYSIYYLNYFWYIVKGKIEDGEATG